MKNGTTFGARRGYWRLAVWGAAATLILLPLIAMQFTVEVDWGAADFAFAGGLVVGVGLTFELALRASANHSYRSGVAIALVATFLLIWINLAVGIIGNEGNPANLMYGGVLAVGVGGVVIARFRPHGMARAMVATAIAQTSVAAIALVAGMGFTGPITIFFDGLWFISAWLFFNAARDQPLARSAV